jgi:hypothetical protein
VGEHTELERRVSKVSLRGGDRQIRGGAQKLV